MIQNLYTDSLIILDFSRPGERQNESRQILEKYPDRVPVWSCLCLEGVAFIMLFP